MDFVEDDQLGCLPLEEELGLLQLGPVLRLPKVEINRWALLGDLERERCLANLARPDDTHSCLADQRATHVFFNEAINHPCIFNTIYLICNVQDIG